MASKPWYASRTVWLNVVAGVTLLGAYLTGDIDKHEALYQFGTMILALLNVILRLRTNQPIE